MIAREIIESLLQSKLELQDNEKLEQFWFVDEARVVATLGTKDGAVCGPVLNYAIGDDDSVSIGNRNESLAYKWEQLRISGNELIVMCDGAVKTFSITKATKKERWLP